VLMDGAVAALPYLNAVNFDAPVPKDLFRHAP